MDFVGNDGALLGPMGFAENWKGKRPHHSGFILHGRDEVAYGDRAPLQDSQQLYLYRPKHVISEASRRHQLQVHMMLCTRLRNNCEVSADTGSSRF
jgi:hypothetical protein